MTRAPSRAVKASTGTRRLNRAVPVGEAMAGLLDPAFRKRGFASRDLLAHWAAIAPRPYDALAMPDRLLWPRREAGAEGAILFLRCAPGHALMLSHEAGQVAAAINRYFGYVLVGQVKLSATPFTPGSPAPAQSGPDPDPALRRRVHRAVQGVGDEGVRQALEKLGRGVFGRKG